MASHDLAHRISFPVINQSSVCSLTECPFSSDAKLRGIDLPIIALSNPHAPTLAIRLSNVCLRPLVSPTAEMMFHGQHCQAAASGTNVQLGSRRSKYNRVPYWFGSPRKFFKHRVLNNNGNGQVHRGPQLFASTLGHQNPSSCGHK